MASRHASASELSVDRDRCVVARHADPHPARRLHRGFGAALGPRQVRRAGRPQRLDRFAVGERPWARLSIQIPPHHQPVAAVAQVERIPHLAIEVAVEPVAVRSQLRQVEVRIAGHQRIERPAHHLDALIEGHRPLRELQREAHAAVSAPGQGGQHVRMHVESVLGVDPGPPQDVADQFVAVERTPREVAALGDRPHHLARHQVVVAPGLTHHLDQAVGVVERGERLERHAGRGRRLVRPFPRLARHGAEV